MTFLKGNRLWDNPKTKSAQFKKGVSGSTLTQFQKGREAWNKGKKGYYHHADEWKKKRSKEMSGDNHPNWKKNRSEIIHNEYREYDIENKKWTKAVKDRDGWKCKINNQDCCGWLYAHHILNWIDYPELRYQVNNGITLCHAHHPRKWAEEKRLILNFQELVSVSNVIL